LTLKRLCQKGIDPYDQLCPVAVDITALKPHFDEIYVALPHTGQGFNNTLRACTRTAAHCEGSLATTRATHP
ncbi:MAG: hypothetical protein ACKPKO_62055, partial [Candidatus Fonsibacter sp.]